MEKSTINEILQDYTASKVAVEEANAALAAKKANIRLNPGKNVLTEAELRATTVGCYPEQANGFGLLDSGTGTLDKAEVRDGKLVNCDMGESYALFIICGKTYAVHGAVLAEKA